MMFPSLIWGLCLKLQRSSDVMIIAVLYTSFIRFGPSHKNRQVIHSDLGSQYCAKTFRKMIEDNGLAQSMSRKGN